MTELVCEVCSARQRPATSCARCGLPLRLPPGVEPVADPPITPLPGLEPTIRDPALVLWDDEVPGLERTIAEPAPDVPVEFIPGFEPTAPGFIDLPGEDDVLPGIERLPVAEKTMPEAAGRTPHRCPYCGYVREGRICHNCGRAKSRLLVGNPDAIAELMNETDIRCVACGSLVPHRARCVGCGEMLPGR